MELLLNGGAYNICNFLFSIFFGLCDSLVLDTAFEMCSIILVPYFYGLGVDCGIISDFSLFFIFVVLSFGFVFVYLKLSFFGFG